MHEGPISTLIPQGVKSIAAVAPTSFRKARLLARSPRVCTNVQMFVRVFNLGMDMRARATRPDRKAAILLAAEKLFAQRGYHAVTIRQIADEAGVPLALVGYYYGQKQALFEAIFAHWNGTIEERLHELQLARQTSAPQARLERIVEAFVGPVLRLRDSAEGEYYALLVARELAHATDAADRVLKTYFDPLAHAFIDALAEVLPQASRAQVAWGYQFALGALVHHISDKRVYRLSLERNTPCDPAARPALIHFIVGGLKAALPSLPAASAALSKTQRRLS